MKIISGTMAVVLLVLTACGAAGVLTSPIGPPVHTEARLFLPLVAREWDGTPPLPSLRILDKNGNLRDWAWLHEHFGAVALERYPGWQVAVLQEREGPTALTADLGRPGVEVVVTWPGGPPLPAGYERCGQTGGLVLTTNAEGKAEFAMGGGSYYFPPDGGPHCLYVPTGGDCLCGLGMLGGTNHVHLDSVWGER